jgi:uncharacterized protein YdeI (YjbR/CyaY-like superfamily)
MKDEKKIHASSAFGRQSSVVRLLRFTIHALIRSVPAGPTFFKTPAALRAWFKQHHASGTELLLGFYKVGSGRPSVTYQEALDEALVVGWIDGIRKGVDDESYTIRFTPRKKGSYWSAVNTKRAHELIEAGRMTPAGRAAFDARDATKTEKYSSESRIQALSADYEKQLQANPKAWAFFQSQPPGYRRTASFWVMSAKQEATQLKRLKTLIADSARGERIGLLRRN